MSDDFWLSAYLILAALVLVGVVLMLPRLQAQVATANANAASVVDPWSSRSFIRQC